MSERMLGIEENYIWGNGEIDLRAVSDIVRQHPGICFHSDDKHYWAEAGALGRTRRKTEWDNGEVADVKESPSGRRYRKIHLSCTRSRLPTADLFAVVEARGYKPESVEICSPFTDQPDEQLEFGYLITVKFNQGPSPQEVENIFDSQEPDASESFIAPIWPNPSDPWLPSWLHSR